MDRISLAASFVESRGPGIHRAFNIPAEYDITRKVFVPRRDYRSWEPMKANVDDLEQAVEEYRTNFDDLDRLLDLKQCTWADVFKQMEDARIQYDEKREKGLGRCRALWHKFGNSVKLEDIDPWLDLIPDDYGLSVIRGSIVLILRAARHSAQNAEKILKLMIEIVDTVALACPKAKIFGSNQSIDTAVRKLYVTVLDSVATIVRYLRGTNKKSTLPWGRGVKDKFIERSNDQVSEIERRVEQVRENAKNFETLYLNLKDELQYDTWARVQEMSTDIMESQSASQRLHKQLLESMEQEKSFRNEAMEQLRRHNELLEEVSQQQRAGLRAKNDLLRYLNDYSAAQEAHQARNQSLAPSGPPLIRSITPISRSLAIITVDGLCNILGISPRLANDDLETVIGDRSWFNERAQGVAQSLLDYTEFRDWFVGMGSHTLLVNGSDEEHANAPISAMSILAVDIMSTLTKADQGRPVAVFHFFCGLHSTEEEGPRFMMKALILQLLFILHSHGCLNLEFINSEAYVVDLQNANSAALLHTIRRLCLQLPPYLTVYCFIDGVSFYESRWLRFHDGMVGFLHMLRQVMLASEMTNHLDYGNFHDMYGSASPRYNLKVLLTSANGTIFDQYMQSYISLSGNDVGFGFTGQAAVEDGLAYMREESDGYKLTREYILQR